jgi:hypothetical protein
MTYSFRKHIQNEYFTGLLFWGSIIPIILGELKLRKFLIVINRKQRLSV